MSASVVFLLCVLHGLSTVLAQAASDANLNLSTSCWRDLSKLMHTEDPGNATGTRFDGIEDFARALYGAQVKTQQKIEESLGVTKAFLELLESRGDFDSDAEVMREFLGTAVDVLPVVWPSCPVKDALQHSITMCVKQDLGDMLYRLEKNKQAERGSSSQEIGRERAPTTKDESHSQKQKLEADEESTSFEKDQTRVCETDYKSEFGDEKGTRASSKVGPPTDISPLKEVEAGNNNSKNMSESLPETGETSCTKESTTDDCTERWQRASHSDVDAGFEDENSSGDIENVCAPHLGNKGSESSKEFEDPLSSSESSVMGDLFSESALSDLDKKLHELNREVEKTFGVLSEFQDGKYESKRGHEDFKLPFEDLIHEMKHGADADEVPDWESDSQVSHLHRHSEDIVGEILPQVAKSHAEEEHCHAMEGNTYWRPGPHSSGRCPLQGGAAEMARDESKERSVTGETEPSESSDTHFSVREQSLQNENEGASLNGSNAVEIEEDKINFGSNLEYFSFLGIFGSNEDLAGKARRSTERSSDQRKTQKCPLAEEQTTGHQDASTMKSPSMDADVLWEQKDSQSIADQNSLENYIKVNIEEFPQLDQDDYQGQVGEEQDYDGKEAMDRQELLDTVARFKEELLEVDAIHALGGGKRYLKPRDIPYDLTPPTPPVDNNPLGEFKTPNPMWNYRDDPPPLDSGEKGGAQKETDNAHSQVTQSPPPDASDYALRKVQAPPHEDPYKEEL